ncbi:hypothetical protein Ait01nite_074150 [Actinoplanes italicus]|uniref:DUF5666 domain-containing protein n=1 Tax=Actinoplanes italicus TaxID=113567 RepID=A0A2T0K0I2_9ACTN|nr:hypothetical protein [Actinoplanes italicus]PRX16294.1 hypothetical protein CLV67_120109 [Actinoplanes italicus]GIE34370.1 hypothetical protein Ait01nite_074150 [Actinoplanes italicus]
MTSKNAATSENAATADDTVTSEDAAPSGNRDTEVLPRQSSGHPDLDEALAAVAPRRWWNRTTVGLLGLALLAGGFLGGVQAHERWGTGETQAGGAPNGAGMPSGFGPAPGGSRGPGAPGARPEVSGSGAAPGGTVQGGAQPAMGAVVGTVKVVDGTTLYVQTDAGETITVRTAADTTVKVSQVASLESITSGLPVTVEGLPDSEGVISATAITAG